MLQFWSAATQLFKTVTIRFDAVGHADFLNPLDSLTTYHHSRPMPMTPVLKPMLAPVVAGGGILAQSFPAVHPHDAGPGSGSGLPLSEKHPALQPLALEVAPPLRHQPPRIHIRQAICNCTALALWKNGLGRLVDGIILEASTCRREHYGPRILVQRKVPLQKPSLHFFRQGHLDLLQIPVSCLGFGRFPQL